MGNFRIVPLRHSVSDTEPNHALNVLRYPVLVYHMLHKQAQNQRTHDRLMYYATSLVLTEILLRIQVFWTCGMLQRITGHIVRSTL
jgi:hypothetical protein